MSKINHHEEQTKHIYDFRFCSADDWWTEKNSIVLAKWKGWKRNRLVLDRNTDRMSWLIGIALYLCARLTTNHTVNEALTPINNNRHKCHQNQLRRSILLWEKLNNPLWSSIQFINPLVINELITDKRRAIFRISWQLLSIGLGCTHQIFPQILV